MNARILKFVFGMSLGVSTHVYANQSKSSLHSFYFPQPTELKSIARDFEKITGKNVKFDPGLGAEQVAIVSARHVDVPRVVNLFATALEVVGLSGVDKKDAFVISKAKNYGATGGALEILLMDLVGPFHENGPGVCLSYPEPTKVDDLMKAMAITSAEPVVLPKFGERKVRINNPGNQFGTDSFLNLMSLISENHGYKMVTQNGIWRIVPASNSKVKIGGEKATRVTLKYKKDLNSKEFDSKTFSITRQGCQKNYALWNETKKSSGQVAEVKPPMPGRTLLNEISKKEVDAILGVRGGKITELIQFVPVDGRGLKAMQIRPGTIFHRLGLRDEDILTHVNGKSTLITENESIFLRAMQEEQEIKVGFDRNNRPHGLIIRIK